MFSFIYEWHRERETHTQTIWNAKLIFRWMIERVHRPSVVAFAMHVVSFVVILVHVIVMTNEDMTNALR